MNKEDVPLMTSSIPIGVSGAIIFGLPLQDWIVIGTALVLAYNLYVIGDKITRNVVRRYKKSKIKEAT